MNRKARKHLEVASKHLYGTSVPPEVPTHHFGMLRQITHLLGMTEPDTIAQHIIWMVGSVTDDEWAPKTVPEIVQILRRTGDIEFLTCVCNLAYSDFRFMQTKPLKYADVCEMSAP